MVLLPRPAGAAHWDAAGVASAAGDPLKASSRRPLKNPDSPPESGLTLPAKIWGIVPGSKTGIGPLGHSTSS